MFDRVKNYFEARLELVKLDIIGKTASVMSKLIGLCVLVSIMMMCGVTALLLLAIFLGYLMDNYLLGITIFLAVIFCISLVIIIFRRSMITKPLKNLFIEYLYDEFTKD